MNSEKDVEIIFQDLLRVKTLFFSVFVILAKGEWKRREGEGFQFDKNRIIS